MSLGAVLEEWVGIVAACVVFGLAVLAVALLFTWWNSYLTQQLYTATLGPWCYAWYNMSEGKLHVVLTNIGLRPYIAKEIILGRGNVVAKDIGPINITDYREVVVSVPEGEVRQDPYITVIACDYQHVQACKIFTTAIAFLPVKLRLPRPSTNTTRINVTGLSLWTPEYNPPPGYATIDIAIVPAQAPGLAEVTIEKPNGQVEKYLLYAPGAYASPKTCWTVLGDPTHWVNPDLCWYADCYGCTVKGRPIELPSEFTIVKLDDTVHIAWGSGKLVQSPLRLTVPIGTKIVIKVPAKLQAWKLICIPGMADCPWTGKPFWSISLLKLPSSWKYIGTISNFLGYTNKTEITLIVNRSGWIDITYMAETEIVPVTVKVVGGKVPQPTTLVYARIEGTWYLLAQLEPGQEQTITLPKNTLVKIVTVSNYTYCKSSPCGEEYCGSTGTCTYNTLEKIEITYSNGKTKTTNKTTIIIQPTPYTTITIKYKTTKQWNWNTCKPCNFNYYSPSCSGCTTICWEMMPSIHVRIASNMICTIGKIIHYCVTKCYKKVHGKCKTFTKAIQWRVLGEYGYCKIQ